MQKKEVFSIILFTLCQLALIAQETTGILQGYILDQSGQPIEFASIKVVDEATNSVVGGISQYNGFYTCLLYTSPSPRDRTRSRMPSSA